MLLATLIIAMCKYDTNVYKLQGESVDCHDYYVNCSINKDIDLRNKSGDTIKKVLQRCKNVV